MDIQLYSKKILCKYHWKIYNLEEALLEILLEKLNNRKKSKYIIVHLNLKIKCFRRGNSPALEVNRYNKKWRQQSAQENGFFNVKCQIL